MPTRYPEIWNALADEFDPANVRERKGDKGGTYSFRYITARTAMNRLDEVLGFENWEDSYEPAPGGGENIYCKITVTLPDGRKITKGDIGTPSKSGDEGTDEKGAGSVAFKRAAVKFGIGRYLYNDGVYRVKIEGQIASEAPAPAPAPVVTRGETSPEPAPAPRPRRTPAPTSATRASQGRAPYDSQTQPAAAKMTGREFFRQLKEHEAEAGPGIVQAITTWGKAQQYPGRIVDWKPDQVECGLAEAVRLTDSVPEPAPKKQARNYEHASAN
jgi:Rad52/22 family double-strand break repair protein